jgi:fibronectin type 3 domain-containing protein
VAAILSSAPPPPAPTPPPPPAGPGTATLSWNPNTEPDVAGYRVYVGLASGVYGPPIDAGHLTTLQVTNLALGQTYYFVVTAVNTSNLESGFSNEVSKSIF